MRDRCYDAPPSSSALGAPEASGGNALDQAGGSRCFIHNVGINAQQGLGIHDSGLAEMTSFGDTH